MDYIKMQSIPRLSKTCYITEKIDGTNACVHVSEGGEIRAGSKNRWLTTEKDNHGFATFVKEREDLFRKVLPPGFHRGEFWGNGIQRGYGLPKGDRRLSLFNQKLKIKLNSSIEWPFDFVPILYKGMFDTVIVELMLKVLKLGSISVPGYMNPEGVVVYHEAANCMFKKTIEHDEGKHCNG